MCYVVLLSTTSPRDLAALGSERVRFERALPRTPEVAALGHPHAWYVGSRSGCSCGFRHLHSTELGFGEPVDWYPEESEDLDATREFAHVVRGLVDEGAQVDCIDVWSHQEEEPQLRGEVEVDLGEVSDTQFRFYENHRFRFRAGAGR